MWEVATHHLTGLRSAAEQILREVDEGGAA
jgi:hypothetical protein